MPIAVNSSGKFAFFKNSANFYQHYYAIHDTLIIKMETLLKWPTLQKAPFQGTSTEEA